MNRVLLAMAVVGLVWCGGCSPSQQQQEHDAVIGVSILTADNPFFNELADAIVEEAAKHKYKVIVVDGALDPVRQDGQVEDFITKQVDAIILCPCDCMAVGATIAKANKAEIPVFTADLTSLSDEGQVVCHVATDNLEGGRKAAEAVIKMLGGSGKVAVLDYKETESCRLRVAGFNEVISKAESIKVVGYWPGGGKMKVSADAAAAILETHPDLDGFFCVNDPSAMGAFNAIEQARLTDQVKVVGFDAQLFARKAVRDGELYATIVQHPRQIGRRSADAVYRYLIGESFEDEKDKQILIPVETYDKNSAENDPLLKDQD